MDLHTIAPFRVMAGVMVLCLAGGLLSAAESATAETAAEKATEAGSTSAERVVAQKIATRTAIYTAQDKRLDEARKQFAEKKYEAACAGFEQVLSELDIENSGISSARTRQRLEEVRRETRRMRHAWGRDLLHRARLAAAEKRYTEGGNLANEAVKIALASRDIVGLEGQPDEALFREASNLSAFCRDMASNAELEKATSFDQAKGADYEQRKTQIRVLLREATTFFKAKRYEDALSRVEQVFILDPFDSDAIVLAGQIYQVLYNYGLLRHESDMISVNTFSEWQWAEPVFSRSNSRSDVAAGEVKRGGNQAAYAKLSRIIWPRVNFDDAEILEVIKNLNKHNKEYDPDKEGIQIESGLRPEEAEKIRVTMSLSDIPLGELLRYICMATGLKFRVDENSIFVGTTNVDDMETHRFQVRGNLIGQIVKDAGGDAGGAAAEAPAAVDAGGGGGGEGDAGGGGIGDAPAAARKTKITEAMLKKYFSRRGVYFAPESKIDYSEQAGLLSVTNTRDGIRRMEELLRQLATIEKPLVLIEIRTLTISEQDIQELGFDWSLDRLGTNNMNSSGELTDGSTGWTAGQGISTVVGGALAMLRGGQDVTGMGNTAVVNSFNIFPALFGSRHPFGSDLPFNIQLTINALCQNERTEALAAPKLLTSSGHEASVSLGKRYYLPESWDDAEVDVEVNNGSSRVTITAPAPTFSDDGELFGVSFAATPEVQPDNYTIRLTLKPSITEFTSKDNYEVRIKGHVLPENRKLDYVFTIWKPVISKRIMSVQVDVYDGETVVLGGMVNNSVKTRTDKIPILGDLPIVGRFFQSQAENTEKTNLLIFVTARLVDYNGIPVLRGKNTAQPDFKR